MNHPITLTTFILALASCSSSADESTANEVQSTLAPCDSLQMISTNRAGNQVITTLFHCDLNSDQEVMSYASKDHMIVAERFRSSPDSMICIVHNRNGSVWSRTVYVRNVPVGGVYCTTEDGDTIQYYYHSEQQKGQIAFTALRNVQSGAIQYTGNPIHYISLSADRVRPGDSVWVDIKVCDLQWVTRASHLVESMANRKERLIHEPVWQNESQSSYLLVPNAVGIHTYSYDVEIVGRNGSNRFNRIFTITVHP